MKILLIFIVFNSFDLFICEEGRLLLKYKRFDILNYSIEFNNHKIYLNNRYEYINAIGKICFPSDYLDFENNCSQKYKGFNSKWIVLIESNKTLNEFNQIFEKDENLKNSLQAIIFNNKTIEANHTNLSTILPTFSLADYQFNVVKEYEINKEIHNYFLNIKYIKNNYLTINKVLFYVSVFVNIVIFLFNLYWNMKLNNENNHLFQLQRALGLFPCIQIIISFLMTYYIFLVGKVLSNSSENKLLIIYVDICLQTLISLYRTFFWFFLLLMTYGWQIYRNEISQTELKKFLLVYIGIYLLTYFDQIIDEMFLNNIYGILPSEIKNFIIFTMFTFIIIIFAKKSHTYLYFKYYYATEFLPHYCEALFLKMKMIIYLVVLTILFTLSYFVLIITMKVYIKSSPLLDKMVIHIQETIIMITWLLIFKPREFPANFNELLFDNLHSEFFEIKNTNIYKLKLPNQMELISTEFLNTNVNRVGIDDNHSDIHEPIIIVNPVFQENFDNLMEKISISFNQ